MTAADVAAPVFQQGTSLGRAPKPAFDPVAPTPERQLDEALARLRGKAQEFARAPIGAKLGWLSELNRRLLDVSEEWVRAACRAKGIEFGTPLAGEEWLAGPAVTVRNVRLLIEALGDVQATGAPRVDSGAVRERDGGGLAVQVTPHGAFDKALFGGFVCETWLQSNVKRGAIAEDQAGFYRRRDPEGGVSLVLGAGNVASIPPMDALYKMFVEGQVVLLKMNPVNEYLGPFLARAFSHLIDLGYLAIVYGGAPVGSYLCQHELVDDIHITGSDKTHDLIVWGPPGDERDRRKAARDPVLKKKITSELGNVSPVVVVPSSYSEKELDAMAHGIAGMVTNNASFNCNAAKLLVLPRGWAQRDALMARVGSALQKAPPRKAYYPGAFERYEALTGERAGVQRFGEGQEGTLPWTIVPGLESSSANERNFHMEPFCAILSETTIGSADPAEFLAAAEPFCNDVVWGTLSCMLFVPPSVEKDATLGPAFESLVSALRYGSVAVNCWAGLVYGLGTPPWGGHPSATLENIQSGLGWVHNTPMFESIEKAVLRSPLVPFPKPAWYPGHRTLHEVGRKLTRFEASPSWLKVPSIAASALSG
ncbi:MAG: aldehyde dehydrogenase family protein [Polyangiaceae bacterium]|nr:aldehyde dehydrogenase family protein [Polyangiaceae bacterium]